MEWWLWGTVSVGLATLHAVHTAALTIAGRCLRSRSVHHWKLLLLAEEVLATFNAVLSVYVGVSTVTTTFHDVMHARTPPINLLFTDTSPSLSSVDQWTRFLALYFMYDLWAMYRVHEARVFTDNSDNHVKCLSNGHAGSADGDTREYKGSLTSARACLPLWQKIRSFAGAKMALVCHHLGITLLGVPVVLHYRGVRGDFMIGCFFLLEMSTPFVALRAVLAAFNKKESLLYVVNGYCMMVVFFICRILIFPFMYWACSRTLHTSFLQVFLIVPYFCHLGNVMILSVQIYWFCLMISGAIRILRRRAASNKLKSS